MLLLIHDDNDTKQNMDKYPKIGIVDKRGISHQRRLDIHAAGDGVGVGGLS